MLRVLQTHVETNPLCNLCRDLTNYQVRQWRLALAGALGYSGAPVSSGPAVQFLMNKLYLGGYAK